MFRNAWPAGGFRLRRLNRRDADQSLNDRNLNIRPHHERYVIRFTKICARGVIHFTLLTRKLP